MRTRTTTAYPIIAVIGCDGSGKSTVNGHIRDWISGYGPATSVHLGKQSGNIARRLAHWPVVGGWFERTIRRKTDAANSRIDSNKPPGLLAALVVSLFLQRRLHRFRRMLKLRGQGYIIVTDRYPQMAVARAYDGPILGNGLHGARLVAWLARREQAKFEWMTSHRPELVLRLNVDLDTACARKPDHRRDNLRRKVEITPQLTYNGAPIADIDASQPRATVLAQAEAAVGKVMADLGYSCPQHSGMAT